MFVFCLLKKVIAKLRSTNFLLLRKYRAILGIKSVNFAITFLSKKKYYYDLFLCHFIKSKTFDKLSVNIDLVY